MVQLKSIISGHENIFGLMSKKYEEVELEKNLLSNQLYDHQKQICKLMSDLENRDKIAADQGILHDMEKDKLLSQVLGLQKEVSQLSSCSLTREKEALRKELDKSKSKLKDTECKLKNIIQDKVKLEGEKAQAEREIKSLQNQRAILERDSLKRDSLLDRRHESRSDFNKARDLKTAAQQNLQDYEEFESIATEMEAEITSLKEASEITIREKEEAYLKNEKLNSELEVMTNKLRTTYFEMEMLTEELRTLEQRLAASESSSRGFEDSLDLLSREKEEMILQLTEALLELEVEKSAWAFKEKSLREQLNLSNYEVVKVLDNLSELQNANHKNEECTELKMKLSSTQAKLDTYRRRLKETLDEKKVMDANFQKASTNLKNQLRTYGLHILDLTKRLAEKE